MTTEQLTQEVMNLKEQQAKSQAEHEKFELILSEIQEEVKSTKSLAEDVHIMAINMQNMQKVQEETNRKVDALTSQEFVEYKENKKIVKQNVISKVTTSIITVVFGLIYIVVEYLFYKNIDWKMVIVATILYGVFNIGISKIINKTTKKK